jgi:hypothetical protein
MVSSEVEWLILDPYVALVRQSQTSPSRGNTHVDAVDATQQDSYLLVPFVGDQLDIGAVLGPMDEAS